MPDTPTTDPEAPSRAAQIEGLQALVDFLEAHSDVPVPELDSVCLPTAEARAQLVDGLDAIEIQKARQLDIPSGYMVRRFGPVTYRGFVRLADVGVCTEVPTVTTGFKPWTPGQLADHARLAVTQ